MVVQYKTLSTAYVFLMRSSIVHSTFCYSFYLGSCFTDDGSCSCLSLDEAGTGSLTQELIGSNHDPVYDIAVSKDNIYTACRDGVVRKYHVKMRPWLCVWLDNSSWWWYQLVGRVLHAFLQNTILIFYCCI